MVLILTRVEFRNTANQVRFKNEKKYTGNFWGSPSLTKEKWKKLAKEKNVKIKFKESPKKIILVGESE